MKNILKISIVIAGVCFGTTLVAQENARTAPAASTDKQEPAKASKQEPAKASKQEPAKSKDAAAPAPGAASKTEKADTSQGGGATRMAISEQGIPKKRKKSSSATPTTAPPKK